MSTIEKSYLDEVIEMLKDSTFHIWYSSEEGWCCVSYKTKRVKIDYTQTWFDIENILNEVMIA